MATLLKLLVAALIIHAAVRGGAAALTYYQFRDDTEQVLKFSEKASEAELHKEIVAKAEALDVPIDPDDIDVRRDGSRNIASAEYTQQVELVPRYPYPIHFSFRVDATPSHVKIPGGRP